MEEGWLDGWMDGLITKIMFEKNILSHHFLTFFFWVVRPPLSTGSISAFSLSNFSVLPKFPLVLVSSCTDGPACTLFLPIESFTAVRRKHSSLPSPGPSGVGDVHHIVRQRVAACHTQSHRRCSSLCASLPFARLLGSAADQREAE